MVFLVKFTIYHLPEFLFPAVELIFCYGFAKCHENNGNYPEYGTPSWVVSDKYNPDNTVGDIKFGEQDGEDVDKILYINDPQSDVRIFAKNYKRDMNYRDLADHVPVVVEFGYEKVR